MKRFAFALLILFIGLSVFGCNDTTESEVVDMIKAPMNLKIEGKTLSWDAVDGAKGYIVYADGVEVKALKANSYDFSSLAGDTIVFRVKATAPRGLTDSQLSVSIAFQKNRAATIASIETYIESQKLEPMPEGVVSVLVDKGMTLARMQSFIEAANTLEEAMNDAETVIEMNTAIKTFLALDVDYEPYVSAFLLVMLPELIEEYILYEEDPELISMYQSIIDMLENTPDEMVMGIMATIDYLIYLQEDVDNEFLSLFMDSAYPGSMAELNVAEMLIVKDELVAIMEDHRPSPEYMIVLIDLLNTIALMVDDSDQAAQIVSEDKIDVATGMLMMYDLAVDFIDSFDSVFFTEWTALETDALTEAMLSVEIEITVLKHIATFMNANEVAIAEIQNLGNSASELVSDLYANAIQFILENQSSTPISFLSSATLSPGSVVALDELMDKSLHNILQVFIDTDGELMRLLAIASGFVFQEGQYYAFYINTYLDEEYLNYTEYLYEYTLVQLEVIDQIFLYLNASTKDLEPTDIEPIREAVLASIPFGDISKQDLDEEALATFTLETETAVATLLANLIPFVGDISAYIVANAVVSEYISDFELVHGYLTETYGANYQNDEDAALDNYGNYLYTLRLAKNLNAFMIEAQVTGLENSLAAIFDLVTTFSQYTDLISPSSVQPILSLEPVFADLIDDMLVMSETVNDYEFETLTVAQKEELMAIRERIAEVFG